MLKLRFMFLSAALAALLIFCTLPVAGQDSGSGYLKTSVNPGRAGVFIDGKYVGPAANFKMARKYAVAAGDHEVKLVDPRFEDLVTKVNIKAGKTTVIHETMKALARSQAALRTDPDSPGERQVRCRVRKRQVHGSCGRVQQLGTSPVASAGRVHGEDRAHRGRRTDREEGHGASESDHGREVGRTGRATGCAKRGHPPIVPRMCPSASPPVSR